MRLHLNSVVYGACLLGTATILNASEVRVWGDTTLASPGVFAVPAGLNNAVAVAATPTHIVALRDTGAVVAWGDNSKGQCNVPVAALRNVTAISATILFSFALKSDGSVVGWGDNTRHVLDIPAGLPPVRSIHVQPGVVLVVLNDNTLRMWGDFVYQPPTGLVVTDAFPLVFGGVAIKADGSIVQWIKPNSPAFPDVPTGLIATSVTTNQGGQSIVGLLSGGTVTQWGSSTLPATNLPVGLVGVVEVTIGGDFTIARKSDGTLVTWGSAATNAGIAPLTSWTNAVALSAATSYTAGVFAVGNAPTGVTLTPPSVRYSAVAGTTIGTFNATDPDAGSTFTYEFIDGTGSTDNANFSISDANLIIASSITPSQNSFSIRVLARDQTGNSQPAVFLIPVTDRPSDDGKKCGLGGSGIILIGSLMFGWLRRRAGSSL